METRSCRSSSVREIYPAVDMKRPIVIMMMIVEIDLYPQNLRPQMFSGQLLEIDQLIFTGGERNAALSSFELLKATALYRFWVHTTRSSHPFIYYKKTHLNSYSGSRKIKIFTSYSCRRPSINSYQYFL